MNLKSRRTFVFVRHGESLTNVTHRTGFASSEDIQKLKAHGHNSVNAPLTKKGEWQARTVGELFVDYFFNENDHALNFSNRKIQVHSSGFPRAESTKNLFLMHASSKNSVSAIGSTISPRLRERLPGVGFFMTRREFESKYPEHISSRAKDKYTASGPGGESFSSRERDVLRFITEVNTNNKGDVVLAFTHGGFMIALEKLFLVPKVETHMLSSPPNCMMYILDGHCSHGKGFNCSSFHKIDLLAAGLRNT